MTIPTEFRWSVGRLKKYMRGLPDDMEVVVSSDEEMNSVHLGVEVNILADKDQPDRLLLLPLSGCELEV